MDNKINEAIVLAGGLGTRLRSEIGEFPKPMAPVNNHPFLYYLLEFLKSQGINKVLLSVGYKWEMIKDHFGTNFRDIDLEYILEEKPLGTGGGIRLSLEKIQNENCFIVNGDTFFNINLNILQKVHSNSNADCTLALKEMRKVDRYGSVEVNNGKVIAFHEKKYHEKCLINGGIYLVNKNILNEFELGSKFSFETDYLEKNTRSKNIQGEVFDNYFMDIGIPEDYYQFAKDIK